MIEVGSLRYGVIFKKGFCDVEIFTAFVKDIVGIELDIDLVETEKSLDPPVGKVDPKFALFAEDHTRGKAILAHLEKNFLEIYICGGNQKWFVCSGGEHFKALGEKAQFTYQRFWVSVTRHPPSSGKQNSTLSKANLVMAMPRP